MNALRDRYCSIMWQPAWRWRSIATIAAHSQVVLCVIRLRGNIVATHNDNLPNIRGGNMDAVSDAASTDAGQKAFCPASRVKLHNDMHVEGSREGSIEALSHCGGDTRYGQLSSHGPDRSSLVVETVAGAPDDRSVYDGAWSEQSPQEWRDGGWRESFLVPDMVVMSGVPNGH